MTINFNKQIKEALYYVNNDTLKSLDIFNGILQLEPENIDALNGKASALMKLRKLDEAEAYYKKSLAIKENSSALINLGVINKNKSNYKEALEYFDKAIQIKPQVSDVVTVYKKEIFQKLELDEIDFNLSNFNDKANNLILKGVKYEKVEKYWDAVECYERAIDEDPSSKNVVCAYIRKDTEYLDDDFLYDDKNADQKLKNPLKKKISRILIIERRPKKALKLTNQLLAENPQDVVVLNYKGGIEFSFGEYEESLNCFNQCLILEPNYYYATFNKGLVLRRLKRYDEALSCFEQFPAKKKYSEKIDYQCSSIKQIMMKT